jgi:hypothetical protein
VVLGSEHRHLLDLNEHVVVCSCDECAILFGQPGAGAGKYRAVPRRYLALDDFRLSDEQWDELAIPVNMVYILRSSVAQHAMAFYPGPAGAMESLLDLSYWETLVAQNPILRDLEEDVEALFVYRGRDSAPEYYLLPIDECYRLVGLIRSQWRGLSGGTEVWQAIEQFFQRIRTRTGKVPEPVAEPLSRGGCSQGGGCNA